MEKNNRILIVDDQDDLRQQVAKMLERRSGDQEAVPLIEQIRHRIGRGREAAAASTRATYEVATFAQGKDAYEGVKAALAANRPYAVMFLDMRMPPGWDGLETAQRIRGIDRELQIVIMTAYADYDQHEIAEKIGEPDKLLYIKKPFHPEEVRQLALALTEKWNLNRREKERLILTNRLMRETGYLTRQGYESLPATYNAILNAFISFLDARGGALVQRVGGDFRICAATSEADAQETLEKATAEEKNTPRMITRDESGIAVLPVMFPSFDGFIYLMGKGLSFPFDQLRAFMDILMETARGVLRNALAMAAQQPQDALAGLAPLLAKVMGRCRDKLDKLEPLLVAICDAEKPEARQDLAAELRDRLAILHGCNLQVQTLARVVGSQLASDAIGLATMVDRLLVPRRAAFDEAHVAVVTALAAEATVEGDDGLLQIAFGGLLDDALTALRQVPSGAPRRLAIEAAVRQGPEARVELTFTDTAASQGERLFGTRQGDGIEELSLAAAIARQIVSRHRGSLRLVTDTSGSYQITVTLPMTRR